jgi:hypothetical protein
MTLKPTENPSLTVPSLAGRQVEFLHFKVRDRTHDPSFFFSTLGRAPKMHHDGVSTCRLTGRMVPPQIPHRINQPRIAKQACKLWLVSLRQNFRLLETPCSLPMVASRTFPAGRWILPPIRRAPLQCPRRKFQRRGQWSTGKALFLLRATSAPHTATTGPRRQRLDLKCPSFRS